MNHPIPCRHCGAPVNSRRQLAVAGRTLQPFHAGCLPLHSATLPWYRRPGWPANRWWSLLKFNALLLGLILGLHLLSPIPAPRWPGLGQLLLIVNAWLLLARLISYLSLERHLPPES